MNRAAASLLVTLSIGLSAQADEPDLLTDRPGQSDAPSVVAPGKMQIEAGWTRTDDDDDGVETEVTEVPGTLVRSGLKENLELRLGWTGNVSADVSSDLLDFDENGSGDATIGAKYRIRDGNDGSPEVAVSFGTSLPTGDDEFTSDRADPSVRATVAHSLTDRLSLGYNLGIELATEKAPDGDKNTLASFIYTTSLGIGVTDRLGAFVELYGDVPASAGGGPSHSIDGGFAYLLRHNLQLDVSAGLGLNDRAADTFVGFGVSARFPR
jgi:hypothetical protein